MAPSVRLGEVPILKKMSLRTELTVRINFFRCFSVDSDDDDEEEESHSSREVQQL